MKKNLEKHLTLRERILETIRDAIIKGSLKPGEKVAEPELADRFGISRTPIREAFRQLESEGYLKVIPRKGAVVAAFSQKDVEEFYAIKSILEGYAAKRACENISTKEIEKLETINTKLSLLAEGSDVKQFFKVHNDFHDLFIKAANNEKLYDMINSLVDKFQRLRLASLSIPGRMKISVEEHEKIIEAFRKKNPAAAEKLVRKNAEYGGRVLMGADSSPGMKPSDRSAMLHMDL
ncbi:putative HTH-type transcriptional regulator YdhC [Geobacter sp. OR-1]|uniref:GntR family transcriptional regulator n=1 Tax=Geobacter sp. OR-1 TaxID=1266765 RepID=UPI000542B772|nr:GntR family transcriptional regulator [Geobacter sp. OR-1]GAM09196.1 putative HTH-type transcriptional regulator YdhC [Geobacter sp. OR-1]